MNPIVCKLPVNFKKSRGDKTRTCDLYVPNVARYQLRHTPKKLSAKIYIF